MKKIHVIRSLCDYMSTNRIIDVSASESSRIPRQRRSSIVKINKQRIEIELQIAQAQTPVLSDEPE